MQNKKLYICHTIYHLLIAVLKIRKEKNRKIVIMICSNHIAIDNVGEKLINLGFAKNVRFFTLEEDIGVDYFKSYDTIYIFNDWTKVGEVLIHNQIKYNLIEDGYNYHMYTKYLYEKYISYFSYKGKLKRMFIKKDVPYGYNKYCESIEVNDKSKIKLDRRYFKFKEISRKDLFKIDQETKKKLIDIFSIKSFDSKNNRKTALVLTQPLGTDKLFSDIQNEEEQEVLYKNLVDKYKDSHDIYLKIHPRDTLDYKNFKDVKFLEKLIPMEVYEVVGGYHFDIGITHSSTALDFMTCVDEKIVLYKIGEE